MFNLGPMELLVIVVVALVVLGPQRLPEAMRQLGKGVAEVRRWSSTMTTSVQSAFDEERAPPAPPSAPVAAAGAAPAGVEAPPAPLQRGAPA